MRLELARLPYCQALKLRLTQRCWADHPLRPPARHRELQGDAPAQSRERA